MEAQARGPPMRRRQRARDLLVRLFAPTFTHETPHACPICLDDDVADDASVALRCGHRFCLDCVRSYANGKVRERKVRRDQLVCPVVDCKRSLTHRDLRRILDHEIYEQYQRTTQRVRDETSPFARWCANPACGELIMCPSDASTFSCPSCATVGCFHCRGRAHRLAFLCRASPTKREDASYLEWEKSIGDHRAVRACPQCHMRIWKNDGCNHMTCAHCFHQYCWVCDADWHRRHYACGRDADPRSDADAVRRRIAQLEILVVGAIVALLACVSAVALAPVLALVTIARRVPHLVCTVVSVVKALAMLLALPFLLVLALSDAFLNQKPRRRRPSSWQRERSRLWKD